MVQGIDISPGVPSGQIEDFPHGVIAGLNNGGGTITRGFDTTFRGRPAYEVDYVQGGSTFTMEAVVYGSQRTYVIAAPSGPTFGALAGSFVALP
jgi:hypothetical protein